MRPTGVTSQLCRVGVADPTRFTGASHLLIGSRRFTTFTDLRFYNAEVHHPGPAP